LFTLYQTLLIFKKIQVKCDRLDIAKPVFSQQVSSKLLSSSAKTLRERFQETAQSSVAQ
jgi:hypothetical protein